MNTISDTYAPAPAPAGFVPTPADFDEFHRCRLLQEVVEAFPDLPLNIRLGLLDYAAAVLDGNGHPASEPRRAV